MAKVYVKLFHAVGKADFLKRLAVRKSVGRNFFYRIGNNDFFYRLVRLNVIGKNKVRDFFHAARNGHNSVRALVAAKDIFSVLRLYYKVNFFLRHIRSLINIF